jgi:hypothetical protein
MNTGRRHSKEPLHIRFRGREAMNQGIRPDERQILTCSGVNTGSDTNGLVRMVVTVGYGTSCDAYAMPMQDS